MSRFDLNMDDFREGIMKATYPYHPTMPSMDLRMRQASLLVEEIGEYMAAARNGDFVEMIDALADIIVYAEQGFREMGLDAQPFMEMVHQSNMSKANGHRDAGGKWIKPTDGTYVPPDIPAILLSHYGTEEIPK